MTYLGPIRGLPSLKKLPSLRVIGQTPVEERFTEELVKSWMPVINKLTATYDMRNRMDKDDLSQELIQQIWRLTKRIDPVSQPDDFMRMCKTELRNKCVDLSRYIKAQKRMGRCGSGAQCKACGAVSWKPVGSPAECDYCGPGTEVVKVDMLSRDTNLETSHIGSPEAFMVKSPEDGQDNLVVEEMLQQVRDYLMENHGESSVALLNLLINPDQKLFDIMDRRGITTDHRGMILSVYAEYFGIVSDRDISHRQKSIREAVIYVCGSDVGPAFMRKLMSRSGN